MYVRVFQGEYRASMFEEWLRGFKEQQVPHTSEPSLINTLGDKVRIRSWQVTTTPTYIYFHTHLIFLQEINISKQKTTENLRLFTPNLC